MVAEAPPYPLPDRRSVWRPKTVATQLNPHLLALHGAVAEQAGLPGTAAAVFASVQRRTRGHADDHARCVAATRVHLERVSAACR